ncbi:hypothetical protein DM860_014126 [Cuscuta australis]|uniref:L-ascorbate oxidase n=1 Tax=Cuscuta australis TaxID=267555 RepID=A0A328DI80_9ASTE|nr:hypothetical protein DM860_014126 [Cuscuta australis]
MRRSSLGGLLLVLAAAVSAFGGGSSEAAAAPAAKLQPTIRNYKWEVKYELKSPDCYRTLAMAINGETPGPTIFATEGDTVVVEVKNSLVTENLAIHWHGIKQIGTPWYDGTEGVSQCPILPGDTFTYEFVVDKAGTYLYHAHYGLQRQTGSQGMIVVAAAKESKREPFSYDAQPPPILLTDWYHKTYQEQAAGLSAIPFLWVGEPQSLLINGRGKFACSGSGDQAAGVCNATNPQCAPYSLSVLPGKTYRLRIGSLTALSALSFQIEGHNMTVVEADGNYVDPFVVQNLFIYSGETYSVLLRADQDPKRNYWMSTQVVARNNTTPNALAILNYGTNSATPTSPTTAPPVGPRWDDLAPRVNQSRSIRAHPRFNTPPPKTSDRTIVMLNTQNNVDGMRKWAINNVSLFLPHTPYLVALKYKLLAAFDPTSPPDGYDEQNYDIYAVQKNPNAVARDGIYRLVFNSTVDVVLQNANTMNPNNSETHPWHLHGHEFWVLGYGDGKFNRSTDPERFNLVDPIMKNTVPVHTYGWTAIRFKADNPGAWLFHCHLDAHFYMGMGVVFEEGIEKLGKLPPSIMGCGLSKNITHP